MRTLRPDLIAGRNETSQNQQHPNDFTVPGPNFIWCVDGYDKLKKWGIEIYAAVDAYSRYVIWVYVGWFNATGISVARQYLHTVRHFGIHPRFIRSDHGTETKLIASSHHYLHKAYRPEIGIKDCYMYGKSTANIRVESWWSRFAQAYVMKIRVSQLN